MRSSKRGVSYIVTVTIVTAVTIALGLFLWGIAGGWAGASALDIVKETNKGVAQQRSLLVIEFVDLERGIVWVSNPGKVDLVVLSCTIYTKSPTSPSKTYVGLATIRASMDNAYPLRIGSECRLTGPPPYLIEITAIASTLYNSRDPTENIQWAIMVRQDV